MPSFIGQWTTTRYSGNDPANPEMITLTITADADPNALDGAYPRPGEDARLFGPLDATGLIWTARIDERNSSGDEGDAVFFLSADGSTIYGAWQSQQHGNGPQPWFGTRI
ncbi:MAG: hypothetical protein R3F18_01675 [Lysobacterales bacterium]|nr:hypothetical protein [Xanthomonadales bacterium]MCB1614268.1 hypothetical protein [Xanthomonadales bacterium]MCP5473827.1 hypothetical protein [Rhodanobacteraceae bacterium]